MIQGQQKQLKNIHCMIRIQYTETYNKVNHHDIIIEMLILQLYLQMNYLFLLSTLWCFAKMWRPKVFYTKNVRMYAMNKQTYKAAI